MEKATEVFAGAKFELRGWEYSDPDLEGPANTAVLRLSWDKKEDTLAVVNVSEVKDGVITRRTILSVAQRVCVIPLSLTSLFHYTLNNFCNSVGS
jgi:hypothetical protein